MAEDVINSLVNLKLTAEEEEEIQVSEESRSEEMDSCVLSLIGKFLTCKPYNRKAAKTTLRKAWGLDKELQISEVGSNLFQFKFQSEYDLDRILRGGPWCFDNQLLMLTRWKAGMSAKNVVLEHASMWIQIWGVPFDMMASKVAMEIGNKMGVVEDVERRRRTDEQNLFLRVKVALPISKPIRRGGFLMGLDGRRHWVDYKYERLPVFCHFCGVLGHDIRHCQAHYEESKKSSTLEYQYGDWLRAPNGRNRSPPRRRNASTYGDDVVEEEVRQPAEKSGMGATIKTAARVFAPSNGHTNNIGNNEIHGAVTINQPNVTEEITQAQNTIAEQVPSLMQGEDSNCNVNVDKENGLEEENKVVGLSNLRPNTHKAKWTRLNRMEVGPNEAKPNNSLSMLGKRQGEDALFLSSETGAAACSQKRAKIDLGDGFLDSTSAGVDDHPCRG